MIDVENLTHRILSMIEQMSLAIQLMSLISILAGFFVIYSISKDQSEIQNKDHILLTYLGTTKSFLKKQSFYNSFFLSFIAGMVGVLLSFILSYALSYFIFDQIFSPDYFWPLLSILLIVSMTSIISNYFISVRYIELKHDIQSHQ